MVEYISVDSIAPASYNPRKLSDESAENLRASLQKIGVVIPILVNRRNNVIIAGHQRTKCAKSVGYTEIPAIFVDDVVHGDEIKFNQFHNGVENKSRHHIRADTYGLPQEQFITTENNRFTINESEFQMVYVKEICKLMMKYGNVFSAVICKGIVLFADEYVYACRLLGYDVNCYICSDDKFSDILYYFKQDYGVYSYDNIERHTYVQGLAQMNRSADGEYKNKQNKSALYEKMVLPFLKGISDKSIGIFDFGCGKGAYIEKVHREFPNALGMEFYNNNGSAINVGKGNRQIDAVIQHVKDYGRFDVVICDSVLNSVDSVDAENSVVACLNLFTKDKLFISGRNMSFQQGVMRNKKSRGLHNYIYFCDDNNFTANYRKGQWYFQKFHTRQQAIDLLERNGFEVVNIDFAESASSFRIECRKVKELTPEQYVNAIDFEFNLPLPNGKRYGRNDEVKKLFGL